MMVQHGEGSAVGDIGVGACFISSTEHLRLILMFAVVDECTICLIWYLLCFVYLFACAIRCRVMFLEMLVYCIGYMFCGKKRGDRQVRRSLARFYRATAIMNARDIATS